MSFPFVPKSVTLNDLEVEQRNGRCIALFHWILYTCVLTHNRVDLWQNLCSSLLYYAVRVRCRRNESSSSLSHLLMSFLYSTDEGHQIAVLDDFRLSSTGTRWFYSRDEGHRVSVLDHLKNTISCIKISFTNAYFRTYTLTTYYISRCLGSCRNHDDAPFYVRAASPLMTHRRPPLLLLLLLLTSTDRSIIFTANGV